MNSRTPNHGKRKRRHYHAGLQQADETLKARKSHGRDSQAGAASKKEACLHRNVNGSQLAENNNLTVLWWYSPIDHVPTYVEESLVKKNTLLHWGRTERGMMKDQPSFRLADVKQELKRNHWKMSLPQALSFRRTYLKLMNPYKSMQQLRLGSVTEIREAAFLFEQAVEKHLRKENIPFWTEEEQKVRWPNESRSNQPDGPQDIQNVEQKGSRRGGTPDFLLKEKVLVQKYRHSNKSRSKPTEAKDQQHKRKENVIIEQKSINWIEVKMFYGASSIPQETGNAVGGILSTARKYCGQFGPGAMLFMYGCGEKLALELSQVGVIVLDCSGNNFSIKTVEDHQRTWCANENGVILP